MNKTEKVKHLMACLAEECGEVTQVVGKILRFGPNDSNKKTGNIPNTELLRREVNDIIAVADMLGIEINPEDIKKKQEKVIRYIDYADKGKGWK